MRDRAFVSAWPENGDSDAPEAAAPLPRPHPAPRLAPAEERPAHPEESLLVGASGGPLPSLNASWGERLASAAACDPILVEQFRRLAGALHNAQTASNIRVVMVTSSAPGDGKTLTAINLALVLSESYRKRVLLIDADLRRPSIAGVAHIAGAAGLSEALKAKNEQKLAVIPLTRNLTLLPAGRPDPDPIGGLTSARMRRIIDEAAARFDWVILDAPPTGPLADANLLSQMVDGTLFVLRAGRSSNAVVQKALEGLGRERILGVVLNGVDRGDLQSYGPYYASAATDEA